MTISTLRESCPYLDSPVAQCPFVRSSVDWYLVYLLRYPTETSLAIEFPRFLANLIPMVPLNEPPDAWVPTPAAGKEVDITRVGMDGTQGTWGDRKKNYLLLPTYLPCRVRSAVSSHICQRLSIARPGGQRERGLQGSHHGARASGSGEISSQVGLDHTLLSQYMYCMYRKSTDPPRPGEGHLETRPESPDCNAMGAWDLGGVWDTYEKLAFSAIIGLFPYS